MDSRAAAVKFGRVLKSIGPVIADEDHLLEVLQRTVDAARDVVAGADLCGITVDVNGTTYTACSTDEKTVDIDVQQYTVDAGPCLHASRTGESVIADCDTVDARWPEFGPRARELGVHSLMATPVWCGDSRLGAVNLYAFASGAFDGVDTDVVAVLSETVGRSVADYARFRSAQDTADGLRTAMESRAPIEQAKGILMALHRIGPDDAFAMLSTRSQRENRRLRDIATEFVNAVSDASPEHV